MCEREGQRGPQSPARLSPAAIHVGMERAMYIYIYIYIYIERERERERESAHEREKE